MTATYWQVAAHPHDCVGEGPVWIAEEDALYWVDVLGQAINCLSLRGRSLRRWPAPEPIGFLIPRRFAPGFMAGMQSGLHAVTLEPLKFTLLGTPEPHLSGNRFNDAKVDSHGRLWAGTMSTDGKGAAGSLYRLDADHRWHVIERGYSVPNGPAFSVAGSCLYHADSPRQMIFRFEVDEAGVIHDKTPFIRFDDGWGFPDGMTVDTEEHLWVAHWDGGRVSRFDPQGRLVRAFALPASRITSCTFGGPGLDRLFVTSASWERLNEPLAGALFELESGACGLPPNAFAG